MMVIRAKGNIYVPQNPEKPDTSTMRLVQAGLVALVPDDYKIPKEKYDLVGKVTVPKKKKDE